MSLVHHGGLLAPWRNEVLHRRVSCGLLKKQKFCASPIRVVLMKRGAVHTDTPANSLDRPDGAIADPPLRMIGSKNGSNTPLLRCVAL
jgi:hypothetical protein